MKLLIIHQNFPGQFRHVAVAALARGNVSVTAVGRNTAPGLSGVNIHRYPSGARAPGSTHPYLRHFEDAIIDGQQVLAILKVLKSGGYFPDVILAHPGWGDTLFVKDVYPDIPLIHFCEYYYHSQGADVGFDSEFPSAPATSSRIRVLNSMHLSNLEQCDLGIAPTQWQRSLFPIPYHSKIKVIHEGIRLRETSAVADTHVQLPNGHRLTAGQPVVTYVARNLEPYRGFHSFMRSIPYIQAICPSAEIVIVGGDGVSYGKSPVGLKSWRAKLTAEVGFDTSKVHFTGRLPYEDYNAVLQLSKVHVYLTYPFILSWSLLEAMACGCLIVASDTAPVKEVVVDGENGLLVDFFDPEAIASKVCSVLTRLGDFGLMAKSAKSTAQKFDAREGVKAYFDIFERLLTR